MGLALAMEQGRIYMPFRRRDLWIEKKWQTPSRICGDDNTLFCYFEPWTNCNVIDDLCLFQSVIDIIMYVGTYEHVDKLAQQQSKVRNYRYTVEEKEYARRYNKIPPSAIERMYDKIDRNSSDY